MAPNKSSFMFFLKPGDVYQFEIEVFFFNNKTKTVEPMSASSKQTPRVNKVRFGPVMKFIKIDEETFEIVNKEDEKLTLLRNKLSPMLDSEDSMLKKTIISFLDKSNSALLSALNALLDKFHEEANIKELVEVSDVEKSLLEDSSSMSKCNSVSLLRVNSSSRCSLRISSAGSLYKDNKDNQSADSDGRTETEEEEGDEDDKKSKRRRNTRKRLSHEISQPDSECDGSKRSKRVESDSDTESEEFKTKEDHLKSEYKNGSDEDGDDSAEADEDVEDSAEKEDLMEVINKVIEEARFVGIHSENCEVPSALLVNRESVATLRDSLVKHPDKCQCLIGVVRVIKEDTEDIVGKFQVYVNPELFIAVQELSFEGIKVYKTSRIPAVVHTVTQNGPLDQETLGIFLHKNAKEFGNQLRESLLYQDLIRFCCLSVRNQGKGEEVGIFLRQALKDFGKGRQNISLFLFFALLPASYLNKFETFIRLYESGSLPGQGLSSRKLCNVDKNRKSKKSYKLEVPLTLLKLHKKVSQVTRDKMIDDLLANEIDFAKYYSTMKAASEIGDVKRNIEHVSKNSFSEIHQKSPDLFSDSALKKFVGAKISAAGPNNVYNQLVEHVNRSGAGTEKVGNKPEPHPHEVCSQSDNLNMYTLGRKMREFDMVICARGSDKTFNQQNDFCLVEHIKENNGSVGVIIDKDDEKLIQDLKSEVDGTDIVVGCIYVKREEPTVCEGFQKELQAIAVFGDKSVFLDKQIKTFYNSQVKNALPAIIADIMPVKCSILYTFSEESQAFDLDPIGTLSRRKMSLEYLAKKTLVSPLSTKINKKIVN